MYQSQLIASCALYFTAAEPVCRIKPGAAHIAFSAPSRNAVNAFFVEALKAGGLHGNEPAVLDQQTGHYSATVLDPDYNAIEVVHREEVMTADEDMPSNVITKRPEGSQVLDWAKDVAKSVVEDKPSSIRAALQPIINHITNPTVVVSQESERHTSGDANSKALVGTLLGAAAGAAIAYVMTKGEAESSTPQAPQLSRTTTLYRTLEAPPPRSLVSASPQSYRAPTIVSRAPTMVSRAPSVLSPRSHHSSAPRAIEAPRPSPSSRHNTTLIETFIPPTEILRHILPEAVPLPASIISYTPSRVSKAPSHVSKGPTHVSTAKTITQADITPSHGPVIQLERRNTEPAAPSVHGSQASVHSRLKSAAAPSKAPSLLRSVTAGEGIARSSHSHSRPSSSRRSSHHSHHGHRERSRSRESKRAKEKRLDELVMPDDSISRIGAGDGDGGGEERRRRRKGKSVVEVPREKDFKGERDVKSVVTRILRR